MRLEVQGLRRRFGTTLALSGLDLEFASGSRTALIGPNGSGKSTLMRAILGLIRYEGTIAFDGKVRTGEDDSVARAIAYVPQVAPRLAVTVTELIDCVARMRGTERSAYIEDLAHLELDFATIAKKPLRNLSGGMRQKVIAALATASAPRLLVLDEPTASMDASGRRRFFERIEALPSTTTVLLCSHRLDELRWLVDRVVVLHDSRAVFAGPAAEYLAQDSSAIVGVLVRGRETELSRLGFTGGRSGWWSKLVPASERTLAIREVFAVLGDDIEDVLAEDLEHPYAQDATGAARPSSAGATR
jgi:ABC-type multidrug transport system ATPase subunit